MIKLLDRKQRSFIGILTISLLLLVTTLVVSYGQKHTNLQEHAASSTSPSGEAMPVGDLPGWHQIFTDDFTTNVAVPNFFNVYGSKWTTFGDGGHDTTHNGTRYDTKTLSVSNGILNDYIHTELINGTYEHIAGSPVPILFPGTAKYQGQTYGRYSVRMRADMIPTYKTAFLLWPDSQHWSYDGEIDFPESLHDLAGPINAAVWWQYGSYYNDNQTWKTVTAPGIYNNWHTYTIDWTPKAIVYYIDGNVVQNFTGSMATWPDGRSKIPNTPMFWVLQTETQTTPAIVPNNATAGYVQVDWAVAYSYDPSTAGESMPNPASNQAPAQTYNADMCTCGGITNTALLSGQQATITAYATVSAEDAGVAQVASQKFYVATDAETMASTLAQSDAIPATVTKNTPAGVEYQSQWTFTLPVLQPGVTYRLWSEITCQPKTTAMNIHALLSKVVLGAQTTSLWQNLLNLFMNLFGGTPPGPVTSTPIKAPTPTSGEKTLQLREASPATVYEKACSYIKFKANE